MSVWDSVMIWLISSGRKTCVVARSVTDGGMQVEAVYRVMLLSTPAPMLSPVHEQCISLTAVGNMSNSNQAANSLTVIIATSASLLAASQPQQKLRMSSHVRTRTRDHTHLSKVAAVLLDHQLILLRNALKHLLLHTILLDELENIPPLDLSDIMRAVHRLQIGLPVPGTSSSYRAISDGDIDTAVFYTVVNDGQSGKYAVRLTILPEQTIVPKDIQDTTHPGEYQRPRTLLFHRRKELVDDDHLA